MKANDLYKIGIFSGIFLAVAVAPLSIGAKGRGKAPTAAAAEPAAPVVLGGGAQAADAFQRSYDSEALGKLQEALSALDSVANKNSYVAQYRRGWLFYRLGKYSESIEGYNQAIALAPSSVEARLGVLLPQMALRRWSDVESAAKGALRLDGANYLANLRLAFAYYNLHRYADAVSHYGKLHQMHPSDVEVLSGLGWSLLKLGKKDEAAERFRALLEIAPRHALAKEGIKAAGG